MITPEPRGTLRIAIEGDVDTLDPLLAADRAERLAARQVYEPLISRQVGPFGQTRTQPGLVQAIKPSAGATIWTAELRAGIRFGDGDPLDADAVLDNVERWMAVAPGPELVPELSAADSPRPGLVRFLLDRPDPGFPQELGQARLGIVAPDALAAAGPAGVGLDGSGTGPFELREGEAGRTLLARNASWWGTELGLGPGVDQIELDSIGGARLRAGELVSGSVEVADRLDSEAARRVESNPLLALVRKGGLILGVERSARGIESTEADQPLSDVWLTDLR